MKNYVSLSFICLVTLFSSGFSNATEEPVVVIVNNENPVEKLSISEAKLYYMRRVKKRWPVLEKNIRPAERKTKCTERTLFHKIVLGLSDDDVEEYFITKQLQNADRPPDKFATETDLINFVSTEPGAIGYIRAAAVTEDLRTKVKIVLTITP